MTFLEKILPEKGFYCAARLLPGGGFAHTFLPSISELKNHLSGMDANGHTMYVAQGTYSATAVSNWEANKALPRELSKEDRKKLRKDERTAANTVWFRNFFFDIDSGPEKFAKDPSNSYPSQIDSLKALRAFCHETALPFPAIVSSGNGLYAHWPLDEDMPSDKWRALAHILKQVAKAYGFKADPSRTSDGASVLRPVGTNNRKDPANPKAVKLVQDMESMSVERFAEILGASAKVKKLTTPALALPTTFKGINDDFTAGIDGPPASALRVADRCAQLRSMRDSKGDVSEPLWYACIGLMRHCEEGDDLIHEWSQGHPAYSFAVTQGKIEHHVESGSGPTTCSKFGSDNPQGCLACPQANKIKSPIVLGRPELEILETATEEEVSLLPRGYKRAAGGLYFEEEGAAAVRFYGYDLYPCKVAFDSTLGYETVTIRHQMPISGEYKEFPLRSSLLHDPKTLLMTLADNHVQVSGKESRQIMCAYIDRYLSELKASAALATLHSQMGWQKECGKKIFILGDRIYKEDEEDSSAGFARNIPEVAKSFHQKGELDEWVAATKYLSLPGMEPLAFAFLAGAFGAPLMGFTGFAGAMVALVGRSGIGKTLIGEFALSAYGDPEKLILLKNDTTNALVSRLGLYGSLPLYLDEISNIDGSELSDLLYRVTQGRDKARLNRSAQEKAVLNSWNTVALCSSNHSLIDKLSNLKSDASAEINRIMEIPCAPIAAFGREQATPCYRQFHANYGTAGPVYVQYLVDHQDEHHDKIDALTRKIDTMTGARSDERFWSAMAAVAVYGGMIAAKLGLIEFKVTPVLNWLTRQIIEMREAKSACVTEQIDVLGQFLDANAAGVLITTGDNGKIASILREPRGALVARIQADQGKLFISRSELRKYLDRTFGSFTDLKNELIAVGALKNSDMRKVLGSGTYIGGTQQPCWQIDLNCIELGRTTLRVVENLAPVGALKAVGG